MKRSYLPPSCVIALCAAGCSVGQGVTAPDTESSTAVFAEVLDEARAAHASDAQLAELDASVATGAVPVEAAREAARRAVTCMQQAGLDAHYEEAKLAHGVLLPRFTVTPVEGQDVETRIETCDQREFLFLNKAYQLQPSSLEAMERYVEQQAPVLRECLEDNGVRTDPDASGHALANRASQAMGDTAGEVNCLAEAGIEAW